MPNHRIAVCAAVVMLVPALARAQGSPASAPTLARNTVSVAVGYSSEDEGTHASSAHWWSSPGVVLTGGHRWTPSFSTNATLGWWSQADRATFESSSIQTPAVVLTEHVDQLRLNRQTLALTATYDFLHNAWIEPYVAGGMDVSCEQWTGDEETQILVRRTVGTIVTNVLTSDVFAPLPASTITKVRWVAVMGAKAYVTQRAYLRGELRLLGTFGFDRVVWLGGAGFDF